MSDDEGGAVGVGPGEDSDLALPKATVGKFVSECVPGKTVAKDARDLVAACCKEFILLVSSEAQEICDKDSKKTMNPEHIVDALNQLGFEKYVDEVRDAISDNKSTTKERVKRTNKHKTNQSGMTDEELLAQQEKLFAASKARFEGGPADQGPSQ